MKKDVWWPQPARAARWGASAVAAAMLLAGTGAAREFGPWSAPVNVDPSTADSNGVNTSANDGCPILSPYDQSLYMASNRPGSVTNPAGTGPSLDIWIAPREGDGWGDPVNAGDPINTAADEFCPTPARGNRFFFVRRGTGDNIGDTDIYVVKKLPTGWGVPERLPKGPGQINSDHEEWSPSVYETADGTEVLYFASTRGSAVKSGPTAKQKIYYSVDFGAAQIANGVNSDNADHSDARPNVRRDGLEIVFDSTRQGGPPDIWSASRDSVAAPWNEPVRLAVGPDQINSAAGESRPSLSWDGTILMFGTTRLSGSPAADIFMSTREKLTGRR